jgi:hypothetical protein
MPTKHKGAQSNKKRVYDLYDVSELQKINKTSRHAGAVGGNPVVPRVVRKISSFNDLILDFGAGKTARHALSLQNDGYNVIAYDFGQNFDPTIHNKDALKYKYDIVYASNVINVQPRFEHIGALLDLWRDLLRVGGKLVVNYPSSPRGTSATPTEIEILLRYRFSRVERITGFSSPVWICVK